MKCFAIETCPGCKTRLSGSPSLVSTPFASRPATGEMAKTPAEILALSVQAPVCNMKCHRGAVLCCFLCVAVAVRATGSCLRVLHKGGNPSKEVRLVHSGGRRCHHRLNHSSFSFYGETGTSNRDLVFLFTSHIPHLAQPLVLNRPSLLLLIQR